MENWQTFKVSFLFSQFYKFLSLIFYFCLAEYKENKQVLMNLCGDTLFLRMSKRKKNNVVINPLHPDIQQPKKFTKIFIAIEVGKK